MNAPSNTGTILDRILEARRAEVDHRKRVLPETALKYGVKAASPVRDFAAALSRKRLDVRPGNDGFQGMNTEEQLRIERH